MRTDHTGRIAELGDFLRSRRDRLRPEDAGLPVPSRTRTRRA
ncbi:MULTISPECIES: hypothetical protein [unclassified Streptomyces]